MLENELCRLVAGIREIMEGQADEGAQHGDLSLG
jgi:hypothetical protein